jgi:hypothetical protein
MPCLCVTVPDTISVAWVMTVSEVVIPAEVVVVAVEAVMTVSEVVIPAEAEVVVCFHPSDRLLAGTVLDFRHSRSIRNNCYKQMYTFHVL